MSFKNNFKTDSVVPLPLVLFEEFVRFAYRVIKPEYYMQNFASDNEKAYYEEQKQKQK